MARRQAVTSGKRLCGNCWAMRLHGDVNDRSDSKNSFSREESHEWKKRSLRGIGFEGW
jgi:hypothetical protein